MPVGRALMMRPHPPLPGVSSADLRGVLHPAAALACDRFALPHDVGRTVSGVPAAESREPLRYNEEGLGRVTVAPKPLVGLALLRSPRPVEAADATGDDAPGHQAFALCRRTILLGRAPRNQGERRPTGGRRTSKPMRRAASRAGRGAWLQRAGVSQAHVGSVVGRVGRSRRRSGPSVRWSKPRPARNCW